ncbi:MAG: hypothetical protein CVT66_07520 [Actinobacteria bacterium HGW-Actinobacteria-6]|nr:MAG: hypothetical protein CVT66_07520 [Actinobacteria bacterium HGW-Actinobacteria-6]
MGAAARKMADDRRTSVARPHLRLVPASSTKSKSRSRSRAASHSAGLFRACCLVMVALACVGMLRVAFAVQAEEAAIDAMTLRADIRSEELAGKTLEADASALKSPSRIEAIAGSALNMTEAQKVRYIDIPSGNQTAEQVEVASLASDSSGVSSMLAKVMDMAAGEAQVLLVGDVGLSSR